ncbi:MAG: sigma-70 family RNA polymerase sigma factor [Lapillicoccus sp.]
MSDLAAPVHPTADDLVATPDETLVRLAALGDRVAFATIVRRHGPGMFRYAATMLDHHVQDAEDAVQNALAKVWRELPRFRGESTLRTWLFRIVANEALALRRRRRPVAVDDEILTPLVGRSPDDPEAAATAEELHRALVLALGELPWRQRACWVLAEQEGLSYTEIATTLDTTVTVVRGQLARARRTLAVRMNQWT